MPTVLDYESHQAPMHLTHAVFSPANPPPHSFIIAEVVGEHRNVRLPISQCTVYTSPLFH